ncbi:hypothetical protein [Sphingobium mellinum]|uniref:hypothetical protein n=1 Tax=Sphingobium mellinum TaxID=1387166 RepID=UPI0030EDC441
MLPDNLGTITLSGTYFHQDAAYNTENNIGLPEARMPSFGVSKARLEWRGIAGSKIDAALFADNIFDKEYRVGGTASGLKSLGFATASYGDPRTYGLELRVSW